MAAEEVEYESDPEEAKLSLKMRRREASDDEEEEAEQGWKPPRRIESDGESEGAAAEYEEELDEEEEDYDLDEEEIEGVAVQCEEGGGGRGKDVAEVVAVEREESGSERERNFEGNDDAGENNDGDKNAVDGEHEEEKKEVEPFSVPTAGAFYMHDDRFRDNAGGRNRRTLGGRKLWESQSQDDRKWGHDKFEELTMQERHHGQGRRGARGRHRGRNRNRATDPGFAQVNRPKEYINNSTENNNYQGSAPKGVRGRGPRRYQPSFKNNNDSPATQNKYPGKSVEKHSNVSSRRSSEPVSNAKPDVVPRKQVASNLNIASPPFYPTGSSTKDNTAPPKRDVHASTVNRGQQPVVGEKFTMSQSTATMRGKNIVDSIGQPQLRGQGRGPASFTQMVYQPVVSNNQHNRVPPPNQQQNAQRNSGQSRAQSSLQDSSQQFTQRVPSNSQAFSPPKAAGAVNTSESGDVESASELNQPKTALVAKGKGSAPGSTKGSFLYGGAQVMGSSASMGSGPGDQNFPAFLPVMQFGGQHPGGIGVPAVGMAFPGYVGQPQLGGLGSSEMTWLPVLAGAAGALGATYCPPYITVDGSYNARPSGQESSTAAASSKENSSATKGPSQRPDLANDDFGQRQKNPRRYTEMKFDQ
ncbi:protein MLN51 homolog isoform X1 [Salvia splendens]|uniref:protein MLN51 homolog isoform X1 n=1 Tax=Salvia splendens TaxID=180675 RepID=UPI001C27BDE1|nr:protein MLN51 homolog isoform X1 [Salvia splendens]